MRSSIQQTTKKHHVKWRRLFFGLAVVVAGGILAYHYVVGAPSSHHQVDVAKTRGNRYQRPVKKSGSARSIPAMPASFLMRVPAQSQFPQLPNGCEVTSLSMLLDAIGHPVSKMTLAQEMPKDPTPVQLVETTDAQGQAVHKVVYWGNPNVGFVGSVYKAGEGYGIYNGPMMRLLNQVVPGQGQNLTHESFNRILAHVAQGVPVEVWTTLTFKPTADWITWNSPEGSVQATPLEHAVIIVGYNRQDLFINNPWTGQAAEKVAKAPFIAAWKQLGEQAITVKAHAKTGP